MIIYILVRSTRPDTSYKLQEKFRLSLAVVAIFTRERHLCICYIRLVCSSFARRTQTLFNLIQCIHTHTHVIITNMPQNTGRDIHIGMDVGGELDAEVYPQSAEAERVESESESECSFI